MPTISIFYGIIIRMFWRDHAPPHFHARYQKYKVQIDIQTLETIKGKMPNRALSLILEWAAKNRSELLKDWDLCQKNQAPHKIPPLK
jgi:Domain of unknown function (DUF4160)